MATQLGLLVAIIINILAVAITLIGLWLGNDPIKSVLALGCSSVVLMMVGHFYRDCKARAKEHKSVECTQQI